MLHLIAVLALGAGLSIAQEFRATISGRVFDSTGSAVPSAKVTVVSAATNETSTATTDNSGAYTVPFLRPGQYRMEVAAPGFKTYERPNLTLQVSQVAGIDVTLELGQLSEKVTVTAEAAILETQTASRGGVVNSLQVSELPLNSRNPFMLGAMMSGVTFRGAAIWQRPFDNGAIAEWSVNGGRQSNNEFLMDGAPNNAQAGNNNIAYVPIVDAVQEFSIQTNSYDAQYGRTGGGVFNVLIKSGTNDFHGVGWWFGRRKWLDANSFQNNAVGTPRPNHSLDQYGFQLDGPIYIPKILPKDSPFKIFYLGSFENYREVWPQFLINSYPEPEMRTGDFSKLVNAANQQITIYNPFNPVIGPNGDPIRSPFPDNKIPSSLINPVAAAVTKYMPLPNAKTAGVAYSTQNRLNPDYAATDKFYNLILKFDLLFGSKNRAFMRHASNDRTEDRCINGICDSPGTDGQQPFQRINDAYVVDWVYTASPTMVVNVRGSYNRFIEKGFGRANEDFNLASLGLPQSLINQLPQPAYFGRWEFGGVYSVLGRSQSINTTNNYTLMGNVTKIAGPHTMKMGVDIRRIHYLQQNTGNILFNNETRNFTQRLWNQGDPTSGDPYASFLLGLSADNSNSFYPLYPYNRWWYSSLYFQDDWKVSRKLTLNLGVRWDYNGAPDEKWLRMNRGFDSTLPNPVSAQIPADMLALYPNLRNLKGGFRFVGVEGEPTLAANRYFGGWQMRLGGAYRWTEKLIMRGGYGRYFLNPNNNYLQFAGFQNTTPIQNSLDGGRTPVPNVLSNPYPGGILTPSGSSLGAMTFLGRNNNWFNPQFTTPYMDQFSFGFQYQTSTNSMLDISYVGSRTVGANDERQYNIPSLDLRNKCNLQTGGSPAYCNEALPNPFKGVAGFAGTPFYTANTLSRFQLSRPFPQFSDVLLEQGRNDSSIWYNSMQVNYNLRLTKGLNLLSNFTWSKMVERWGYNDPYAYVQQQGLYFNDRRYIFKLSGIYELPFGKGQKFGTSSNGFVNALIGGWQVSGYFNDSSGEPNDLPGNVIQLFDPQIKDVDWKAYQVRGWSPCVLRQFNDGSIRPQQYSLDKGCGTDVSKYPWLMTADYAPRYTPSRSGQIKKQHAFTMDMSLNKTWSIKEQYRIQLRIEAFNVMNHNFYGRNDGFITDPNSPNFGTLFPSLANTQNGYPRQVQIGIKGYF